MYARPASARCLAGSGKLVGDGVWQCGVLRFDCEHPQAVKMVGVKRVRRKTRAYSKASAFPGTPKP
eukprot:5804685-Prymnesium_polylepis.1